MSGKNNYPQTLIEFICRNPASYIGKTLMQNYGKGPEDTVSVATPIMDVLITASGMVVICTTDALNGKWAMLDFDGNISAIDNIYQEGDIWFSPDEYAKSSFGITNGPQSPMYVTGGTRDA